jgi:hypothetical protein
MPLMLWWVQILYRCANLILRHFGQQWTGRVVIAVVVA